VSTNLQFAAGEANIEEASFSPSVILFWLKTNVGVSSTRVVTRAPNTILGVIPLGYVDAAYPLTNVASVGVNSKFSLGRLVFGLIFLIAGIASITKGVGFVLLVIAAALLSNTFSAALTIQNNAGGVSYFRVSILEKSKLEQFREVINQRLFTDHAEMRHNQQIQVQNELLRVQQQQLNAQIMQQNAQLQGDARRIIDRPGEGAGISPPPGGAYLEPPSSLPNSGGTLFCGACGTELKPGARFCQSCGAPA
jgi:hypothetical protein